jgi:hypothetical protein
MITTRSPVNPEHTAAVPSDVWSDDRLQGVPARRWRVIDIDIEHFRARLLQDCLTEATAMHWLGRSQAFRDAAPRPSDFHGRASRDQLADAYQRCMATAAACHAHARLLFDGMPEEISAEVLDVLGEVA